MESSRNHYVDEHPTEGGWSAISVSADCPKSMSRAPASAANRNSENPVSYAMTQPSSSQPEVDLDSFGTMSPSVLDARLRTRPLQSIVALLSATGPPLWLTRAILVGVARQHASRGDQVIDRLARETNLSISSVVRLGATYRHIVPESRLRYGCGPAPLEPAGRRRAFTPLSAAKRAAVSTRAREAASYSVDRVRENSMRTQAAPWKGAKA